MPREIPKFMALEKLKIRTVGAREARLVFAGEILLFNGKPGASLLPLNGSARQSKLRALQALLAERGSGQPTDTLECIARGLGFEGHGDAAAAGFVENWIAVETARQTAAPSTNQRKLP